MRSPSDYRRLLLRTWEDLPPYPEDRYAGRGIVMCAGGLEYLTNAFVCLRFLRELTDLPVELFHAGPEEMPESVRHRLEGDFPALTVRDVSEPALRGRYPFLPVTSYAGTQIKPFALLHSRFEEVFYIDADNVALRSPDPLFEVEPFEDTGAVFWPDFAEVRATRPELFDAFGIDSEDLREGPEFESGQIVLDKRRCWKALLTMCFAHSDVEGFRGFCARHAMGDKDVFRLAFEFAQTPYHRVEHPPTWMGNRLVFYPVPGTGIKVRLQHDVGRYTSTGMLQHGLDGEPLFAHKTICEWDAYIDYRYVRYIAPEGETPRILPLLEEVEERGHEYLEEFRRRYLGDFPKRWKKTFTRLGARVLDPVLDVALHVRRLRSRLLRS